MLNKIQEYLRITPRSLFITLLTLVLADLICRSYWTGLYQSPANVRLVNTEVETIRRLEEKVRSVKGYKIVFLGDSQAYGSSVKNGYETVPAYLEQELRRLMPDKDIKIFNFAFKGMGISENYFVLNSLVDEDVDLIIYNLSTSWFNRTPKFDHPNVINLSEKLPVNEKLVKMGIQSNRDNKDKLSDEIGFATGRVWSLYGTRAAIASSILGKSVRENLLELELRATNPKEALKKEQEQQMLYEPWYSKDWDKILGRLNYKFGRIDLAPYNPQVVFYKMILETINRSKVNALFYNSPQNIAMLEKFYDMDKKEWQRGLTGIKKMTKSQYVTHLDYSHLVPEQNFTDAIHMDKNGNRLVAQQLAQVIAGNWSE